MKRNLEHKAEDIEFLLQRHPNLRVAYIDSLRINREGDLTYYSVLIKYEQPMQQNGKGGVKEVYRVKLAGNPVLGEGKPENQNHAVIFTRGRYLQTIDMNQDGYFEEALKMRNMLQEFDSGCAILGFREHIFTGSVSSVAKYMALQETSFVTLGQRVLCRPLHIRQHYGHPDFFDKFFVMTEGGVSKASKGINLSEDVFAGFNATIRGHTVGFAEYAQVGKGRDVGLQQTYKFEAKLAQGNAEQSLSRDMFRICDRLDFFRLMSFYYGGIGHYMANTMVMFTLVVIVYSMLGMAIFGQEGVGDRPMKPEGALQLALAGMGILQTMPLAVTLTVEKGFLSMCFDIAYVMLSGGPLYFIFHIQTKSYYFQQTLLAGGAMYRPTGRGFVIRHSPFDENYRFFASSHIYIGFEIFVALILFGLYTTSKQYFGLTWALWLTATSFLLGPFWFNPVTFELDKLQEDYMNWLKWMGETGGSAEHSWSVWWKEENAFHKNLSLSWRCLLFVEKCCVWTFIGCGVLGTKFLKTKDEHFAALVLVSLVVFYIFCEWCIVKLERSLTYATRRFTSLLLSFAVLGCIIALIATHLSLIKVVLAFYYIGSSLSFLCILVGFHPIIHIYKVHDYIVGFTLFLIIGILSVLQVTSYVNCLYNRR
jgi:callose synthase